MKQLDTACALELLDQLPYPYDLASIQLLEELPFDDILDLSELEPKPPKSLPPSQLMKSLSQSIKSLKQQADSLRIDQDKLLKQAESLNRSFEIIQPRRTLGRGVLSLQYAAQCNLRRALSERNEDFEDMMREKKVFADYDYSCGCYMCYQFHWFSKIDIQTLLEHTEGHLNKRDVEIILDDGYIRQYIGCESRRYWPDLAVTLLEPENKPFYQRLERIFLYATGDFIESMAVRPQWDGLFDYEPEPEDARLS